MRYIKTSVVMATYNGHDYVEEQLLSILRQTMPVSEVLIFDDCSNDDTREICQSFITRNKLTEWKLFCNKVNKGYVKNFYDGFKKATGDIIFIADQDDIWLENKVERIVEIFEKYTGALSIVSAYSRFYEDVVYSKHLRVPNGVVNSIAEISLSSFCSFYGYLGMCTAFKKQLISFGYDVVLKHLTYDVAINFLAALHKGFYYVDEVLVNRRTYASVSNKESAETVINGYGGDIKLFSISRDVKNLTSMSEVAKQLGLIDKIRIIDNYRKLSQLRLDYLKSCNICECLSLSYRVFCLKTWKTMLGDIIYVLRKLMKKHYSKFYQVHK
ncbi:MAG: glycosyltransferase [Akkermansia sp.]|nr:glycosyltransferase [Akkermansia sp.]